MYNSGATYYLDMLYMHTFTQYCLSETIQEFFYVAAAVHTMAL